MGCTRLARNQIAQIIALFQAKSIANDAESRIQKLVVKMLKYPESYEPIKTDIELVGNDRIIYDSNAFLALRDLSRAYEDFHKQYGNDISSDSARYQMGIMQALADVICDKIYVINQRPVDLEGTSAYHQFYVDDKPGHRVKKGYHFVIHSDNRITLLCDHDEFLRVKNFSMKILNEPPYQCQWDSVEQELFAPISLAWNGTEVSSKQK